MTKPTENAAPDKPKTVEELYEEARQLSPEERELLAARLIQDTSPGFASPEIEQDWLEEARRRSQLRAEGKTRSLDGEKVFAELRRKYAE
jgi:hypothetical protein